MMLKLNFKHLYIQCCHSSSYKLSVAVLSNISEFYFRNSIIFFDAFWFLGESFGILQFLEHLKRVIFQKYSKWKVLLKIIWSLNYLILISPVPSSCAMNEYDYKRIKILNLFEPRFQWSCFESGMSSDRMPPSSKCEWTLVIQCHPLEECWKLEFWNPKV